MISPFIDSDNEESEAYQDLLDKCIHFIGINLFELLKTKEDAISHLSPTFLEQIIQVWAQNLCSFQEIEKKSDKKIILLLQKLKKQSNIFEILSEEIKSTISVAMNQINSNNNFFKVKYSDLLGKDKAVPIKFVKNNHCWELSIIPGDKTKLMIKFVESIKNIESKNHLFQYNSPYVSHYRQKSYSILRPLNTSQLTSERSIKNNLNSKVLGKNQNNVIKSKLLPSKIRNSFMYGPNQYLIKKEENKKSSQKLIRFSNNQKNNIQNCHSNKKEPRLIMTERSHFESQKSNRNSKESSFHKGGIGQSLILSEEISEIVNPALKADSNPINIIYFLSYVKLVPSNEESELNLHLINSNTGENVLLKEISVKSSKIIEKPKHFEVYIKYNSIVSFLINHIIFNFTEYYSEPNFKLLPYSILNVLYKNLKENKNAHPECLAFMIVNWLSINRENISESKKLELLSKVEWKTLSTDYLQLFLAVINDTFSINYINSILEETEKRKPDLNKPILDSLIPENIRDKQLKKEAKSSQLESTEFTKLPRLNKDEYEFNNVIHVFLFRIKISQMR